MNIKSLLLGSAAALVAVSGARAADAIVAAEPEPVEYVRVCDAFGTGYFYIPGTETCLKIGGYIQYQSSIRLTNNPNTTLESGAGWNKSLESELHVTAKNETEIGTITSVMEMRYAVNSANATTVTLDQGYMTVGGVGLLTVGKKSSFFDFDPTGEEVFFGGSGDNGLLVAYTYNAGAAAFTLALEDDNDAGDAFVTDVVGRVDFNVGDLSVNAAVAYDNFVSATVGSAMAAKIVLGYKGFGLGVVWSEDGHTGNYGGGYEWIGSAGYGWQATEKLVITPSVEYAANKAGGSADDYSMSLNFDYAITTGLSAAARVQYADGDSFTDGESALRLRLKRSF